MSPKKLLIKAEVVVQMMPSFTASAKQEGESFSSFGNNFEQTEVTRREERGRKMNG